MIVVFVVVYVLVAVPLIILCNFVVFAVNVAVIDIDLVDSVFCCCGFVVVVVVVFVAVAFVVVVFVVAVAVAVLPVFTPTPHLPVFLRKN